MIHKNLKIFGEVQGVNFRNAAREKARDLGLVGWVRNESDGTVYAEVEGSAGEVEEFIDWCYDGSPWANVNQVEVKNGKMKNYKDFSIKR